MTLLGPSLHISWEELACRDGVPYPANFVADGRLIELVVVFERVRQHFGSKSLIINSAYRTLSYNKKVGGAPKSQHLHGRALDIQPPRKTSITTFYEELKQNAEWMGIRGLGKYKNFCHIDIRESNKLVTWDLSK